MTYWAVDPRAAAKGFDTVMESLESAAETSAGAAAAVVANVEGDAGWRPDKGDLDMVGVGVASGVGNGFSDDEVDADVQPARAHRHHPRIT